MEKQVILKLEEKKYTFIDLFSGIGAFHQAFDSKKYNCLMACDIDFYCRKTYYDNYGIKPLGDIKEISLEKIPNHDILCAGFPCQPFSISGLKKGFSDYRGDLFFYVLEIIKLKNPKVVILENVKNLKNHSKGESLKLIIKNLKDLNYFVNYKILNSVDFGLPQKRERIFIIASKNKKFIFKEKKFDKKNLIDIIDNKIPGIPIDKLKNLHYNENINIKRRIYKPLKIGEIKNGGQGNRIYSIYGTSITLSASSGGLGSKTGLYYIDGKIRRLTLNECKKIQGFPENFKCTSTITQSYKQFGNTIPVNIIKYIVNEIENQKILEDYE